MAEKGSSRPQSEHMRTNSVTGKKFPAGRGGKKQTGKVGADGRKQKEAVRSATDSLNSTFSDDSNEELLFSDPEHEPGGLTEEEVVSFLEKEGQLGNPKTNKGRSFDPSKEDKHRLDWDRLLGDDSWQ